MIEEVKTRERSGALIPTPESIAQGARDLAEIMGHGPYDQLPLLFSALGQHELLKRIISGPQRLSQMIRVARGEGQVIDFPTPNGLSRAELWATSASLAMDGGYDLGTKGLVGEELLEKLRTQANIKPGETIKDVKWSDQTGTGVVFLTREMILSKK